MANLTITVNDETLKQARIRALQQNTSVNAVLRHYLEEYAQMDALRQKRGEALRNILALAQAHPIDRGSKPWNRDGLYKAIAGNRGQTPILIDIVMRPMLSWICSVNLAARK